MSATFENSENAQFDIIDIEFPVLLQEKEKRYLIF